MSNAAASARAGTARLRRRLSNQPSRRFAMADIKNAQILIMATNGFEQSELEVPRDRLREAGAKVVIASPDGKTIKGWKDKDWGTDVAVDIAIADAKEGDFTALVLPGGVMNPDQLRVNPDAMKVVKDFLTSGKVVAAVCHGPWLLVQADALKGREATSYKSIRKDLENAGAKWVDKEVVVDNGIITSRQPDDLEAFSKKIIEEIQEGKHARQMAAE
ncbi:MAG TPA: type 1 glutamine amidotransferase domain-containing protein [Rhizomicrobium sp.]|nr:type 1 glutamine amidotransferase domain-containing protein [Rhizomicrobium sp.]